MIRLAFDRIASMSLLSIRLASALPLVLFGVFVGYLVSVLIHHFFVAGELVPEWSSLMAALMIFGTIQLLLLGVQGEYQGRSYEQVKLRTFYHVQGVRWPRIADEAPRSSLTPAGLGLDVGAFVGRIDL
jgi:polyisoprenyl-phosphate glycosyltransferase